jgi:hypothetical protein
MQTVEYDKQGALITALCPENKNEDVEVHLNNDGTVIITQYSLKNGPQAVSMTANHFVDLFGSFKKIEEVRNLGKVKK